MQRERLERRSEEKVQSVLCSTRRKRKSPEAVSVDLLCGVTTVEPVHLVPLSANLNVSRKREANEGRDWSHQLRGTDHERYRTLDPSRPNSNVLRT